MFLFIGKLPIQVFILQVHVVPEYQVAKPMENSAALVLATKSFQVILGLSIFEVLYSQAEVVNSHSIEHQSRAYDLDKRSL